jgi:ABC-type polar amino acid transport system ATPase subunit
MIKVIGLEKAFNGLEVLKGLNLTISEKEAKARAFFLNICSDL